MPNSLNCTYSSSGDAFSLKNSLIPFLCDIEQDLSVMNVDELKNHYSIGEVLQVKRGPTADAGFLTTISVGVIFFVAGWAGNKFLDELYEARLRPRIKPWLNKLDVGLAKNSKKSPKQLQVGIWYEDRKVLVLVVIEENSYKEMIESESLVASAHENAALWIEKNGVVAPVHVHMIKDGVTNIEPKTFQTIEEFGFKTRKKRTLTISSSRSSLRSDD